MALSQSHSYRQAYHLMMLKSFLIWTFTLAVCLLIVGFPLIILMVTIGSLAAVVLQSVMPVSAVVLVAGSILSVNVLAVVVGAAVLTLKGVQPKEVDWLRWLHSDGRAEMLHTSVYASCPLTCEIQRLAS